MLCEAMSGTEVLVTFELTPALLPGGVCYEQAVLGGQDLHERGVIGGVPCHWRLVGFLRGVTFSRKKEAFFGLCKQDLGGFAGNQFHQRLKESVEDMVHQCDL
jgi:hypothetical protein